VSLRALQADHCKQKYLYVINEEQEQGHSYPYSRGNMCSCGHFRQTTANRNICMLLMRNRSKATAIHTAEGTCVPAGTSGRPLQSSNIGNFMSLMRNRGARTTAQLSRINETYVPTR
jgi:hypothetical protein